MLRLLGIRALQQVPGGPGIPEVPAEEQLLGFVVLKHREPRRIRVALWGPLSSAGMVRPGYAIMVRFTEGIGPPNPAYGMWHDAHAMFFDAEMFTSKFISLPSVCSAWYPEPRWWVAARSRPRAAMHSSPAPLAGRWPVPRSSPSWFPLRGWREGFPVDTDRTWRLSSARFAPEQATNPERDRDDTAHSRQYFHDDPLLSFCDGDDDSRLKRSWNYEW